MRNLLTLAFLVLVPFSAHAQEAPHETINETVSQVIIEDHLLSADTQGDPCDGFCDGLCLDGECYMDLTPSQLCVAQTGTCPEDPCGGLCLAGICYEVVPVMTEIEPITDSPDAAMIHWKGCPEVPCGGICLAGNCYEVRPLASYTERVEE